MTDPVSQIEKQLKDAATFNIDLCGHAAVEASEVLLRNWVSAIEDDFKGDLISDVDQVIENLKVFKQHAQAVLPVQNGGLGGESLKTWQDRLDEIGVSVYQVEDMQCYGFTECDADEYDSEVDATVAAIQAYLMPATSTRMKPGN